MSLADGLMRLVKGVQGAGGIDAIMGALERKRQAEMQDELMQKLLGATQQNAATTQPANDGSFSAWGGLTTPEQKAQLGQQNKTPMSRVTGVQEIAKYLGQGGNPGVGSLMLGTLPKEPETHVLGKGQTIGKLDGNTFNALFTNPDTERTTKFDDPFEKAGEGYTKDGKFATYRNKYTGEEKTVRLGDTKEPTASTNITNKIGDDSGVKLSHIVSEIDSTRARLKDVSDRLSTASYTEKGGLADEHSKLKAKLKGYQSKIVEGAEISDEFTAANKRVKEKIEQMKKEKGVDAYTLNDSQLYKIADEIIDAFSQQYPGEYPLYKQRALKAAIMTTYYGKPTEK